MNNTEYKQDTMYKLSFHYMHYYPSDIVIMEIPGNLIDRTIELLNKDPNIVIGNIRELDKKNAE